MSFVKLLRQFLYINPYQNKSWIERARSHRQPRHLPLSKCEVSWSSVCNTKGLYKLLLKNWIIGYCNSGALIGLAIMVFEPLYTMLSKHGNRTRLLKIKNKLKIGVSSRCFVGVFNKTVIPLALVGYEMMIANSALSASLAIHHLISSI